MYNLVKKNKIKCAVCQRPISGNNYIILKIELGMYKRQYAYCSNACMDVHIERVKNSTGLDSARFISLEKTQDIFPQIWEGVLQATWDIKLTA